jgi:hypothetical protein
VCQQGFNFTFIKPGGLPIRSTSRVPLKIALELRLRESSKGYYIGSVQRMVDQSLGLSVLRVLKDISEQMLQHLLEVTCRTTDLLDTQSCSKIVLG